jgi:nicotinate-nucleotide adenylyltransferase
MYQNYDFDAICFVVSPSNPLKNNAILLDEHKRLALVKIATADKPYFWASDIEFTMKKPSYTYLTLRKMQSEFPENHYSLILGSDNIDEIFRWKNHEEILENYTVFVYPRGEKTAKIDRKNVIYIRSPLLDISSTMVRERIKRGESVRDLLPEKVLEVVEKEHWYR